MTAQFTVATQRCGVPVIVTLAAMAALAAPTADAAAGLYEGLAKRLDLMRRNLRYGE